MRTVFGFTADVHWSHHRPEGAIARMAHLELNMLLQDVLAQTNLLRCVGSRTIRFTRYMPLPHP